MKCKILLIISLVYLFNPSQLVAQKKNDAGAVAAVVAATAITGLLIAGSIESIKEAMERNMVEWVLENKTLTNRVGFELKLLKWEATKKEDLSNVSVIAYTYKEKGKSPVILLNACSPGWTNENGINFEYVTVYEITPEYWAKIMLNYLNLAKKDDTEEIKNIESIPVIDNRNRPKITTIYNLENVGLKYFEFEDANESKTKFEFNTLSSGDYHIANNFDEKFKIDFNEGNLNLFLMETRDLIRIKRQFIVDITKALYINKIAVNVEKGK